VPTTTEALERRIDAIFHERNRLTVTPLDRHVDSLPVQLRQFGEREVVGPLPRRLNQRGHIVAHRVAQHDSTVSIVAALHHPTEEVTRDRR
jgi:hypothetical protein